LDVQELVAGLDERLVPLDHKLYRALSIAWFNLCEPELAWTDINKSWNLCGKDDPYGHEDLGTEQFYTLFHMGVACTQMDGRMNEVDQYYTKALALKRIESPDERETTKIILLTLGIQAEDRMEGVELLEQALTTAHDASGLCFSRLLGCLTRLKQYEKVVETVTRYGSLRLTMSYHHGSYINNVYQKSAKLAGMTDAMLATYMQLIYDQDPVKWASPAKFFLAQAYRRIVGNNSKAKELLYQILDSDGCIHPATGQEDHLLLYRAQIALSEILYEQFISSASLVNKATLLQEMSSLQNRQLGQKLSVDNDSGSYTTSLARMRQKLDPLPRFYETLDEEFQGCMDTLQDDDPWNDSPTLRQLCKILACLPEFEEDAAIAMCSSFYITDPEVLRKLNNTDEGYVEPSEKEQGDNDGAYDRTPVYLECSGCGDDKGWSQIDSPLYKCAICADCNLCEKCYNELEDLKETKDLQEPYPYCGANHTYIAAPMPGWLGIKKGKIFIKGRDPVIFNEWLKELREEKWSRVWEQKFLG
jgi:hypothetical protein